MPKHPREGAPTALGRRLEVTYVLGGSVRRDSGGPRVELELVRVDGGVTTMVSDIPRYRRGPVHRAAERCG